MEIDTSNALPVRELWASSKRICIENILAWHSSRLPEEARKAAARLLDDWILALQAPQPQTLSRWKALLLELEERLISREYNPLALQVLKDLNYLVKAWSMGIQYRGLSPLRTDQSPEMCTNNDNGNLQQQNHHQQHQHHHQQQQPNGDIENQHTTRLSQPDASGTSTLPSAIMSVEEKRRWEEKTLDSMMDIDMSELEQQQQVLPSTEAPHQWRILTEQLNSEQVRLTSSSTTSSSRVASPLRLPMSSSLTGSGLTTTTTKSSTPRSSTPIITLKTSSHLAAASSMEGVIPSPRKTIPFPTANAASAVNHTPTATTADTSTISAAASSPLSSSSSSSSLSISTNLQAKKARAPGVLSFTRHSTPATTSSSSAPPPSYVASSPSASSNTHLSTLSIASIPPTAEAPRPVPTTKPNTLKTPAPIKVSGLLKMSPHPSSSNVPNPLPQSMSPSISKPSSSTSGGAGVGAAGRAATAVAATTTTTTKISKSMTHTSEKPDKRKRDRQVLPKYFRKVSSKLLGKGTFSRVFLYLLHGEYVAGKEFMESVDYLDFIEEVNCACFAKHPYLVSFRGWYADNNARILFLERMNMTMAQQLKREPVIAENVKIRWCLQAACGLQYLHSQGVVHLDVNPKNIMLTFDYVAKLGDFTFAQPIKIGEPTTIEEDPKTPFLGTMRYSSPEMAVKMSKHYQACDIWSLAMTILQILTTTEPFQSATNVPQLAANLESIYVSQSSIPHFKDPRLNDPIFFGSSKQRLARLRTCLQQCLHTSPFARPSIDDIVAVLYQTDKNYRPTVFNTPPQPILAPFEDSNLTFQPVPLSHFLASTRSSRVTPINPIQTPIFQKEVDNDHEDNNYDNENDEDYDADARSDTH